MMPAPTSRTLSLVEDRPQPKPPRTWSAKFGDAFRGLKLGIRGHASFSVHFFFAALVTAFAIALGCNVVEWCLLIGCIGFVITAELFNSAIETLVRQFDEATRVRLRPALDVSAGAVLAASVFAAVIGAIVFISKLWGLVF